MVVDGSMEKSAAMTEGAFIFQNSRKTLWGKSDKIKWGKMDQWSVFPHVGQCCVVK